MATKYIALMALPVSSNGGSTGHAPMKVRIEKSEEKHQNALLLEGKNFFLAFFVFATLMILRDKIDMRRATTPPSLLGIERRIAYANKKYHSGWIWGGVFNGLAGLKFSGSPINNGLVKEISTNINSIVSIVIISLLEKYG